VQETMSVSACYRALSLTDSKRMFIRITTWVFAHAPLTSRVSTDRGSLRERRRKSPRVNGLVGRD